MRLMGFIVLLLVLLLPASHDTGESNVIGSSQPIVAQAGEDVILPCHLEPPFNVTNLTVEWSKYNNTVETDYVHRHRHGGKSFPGQERTSLFTDELKNGNISLNVSSVNLSDAGKYRCFVPKLHSQVKKDFVHLIVESTEIISNTGDKMKVVCISSGWINVSNPVKWQTSSGMILSVESPEIIQSSDGLYTVSSTVIIKNTNTRSFTCRLQRQRTEGIKDDGSGQSPTSVTKTPDADRLSTGVIVLCVFVGLGLAVLVLIAVIKKELKDLLCDKLSERGLFSEPVLTGGVEPGETAAIPAPTPRPPSPTWHERRGTEVNSLHKGGGGQTPGAGGGNHALKGKGSGDGAGCQAWIHSLIYI
ncbi:butyrophilin subfamily 3 member A2-like [Polymixia lowei]